MPPLRKKPVSGASALNFETASAMTGHESPLGATRVLVEKLVFYGRRNLTLLYSRFLLSRML